MDPSIAVQYGALGTLTIAATTTAGILWKKLQAEQQGRRLDAEAHAKKIEELFTAYTKRLDEITATHKAEMNVLLERLIEGNATLVREYHGLAERITLVLDSLSKKFERRRV